MYQKIVSDNKWSFFLSICNSMKNSSKNERIGEPLSVPRNLTRGKRGYFKPIFVT